jgi:AbrB family looped-hinge helix DNA binding protein
MQATKVRQAKISAKGWIVIPAALRRRYGLTPGTIVNVEDRNGEIVISTRRDAYKDARGMFSEGPSLTEDLLGERAKDREREEAKIRAG